MKKKIISLLLAGIITALAGCGNTGNRVSEDSTEAPGRETEQEDDAQTGQAESGDAPAQASSASVTEGTEEYRGFTLDNVLHSENNGDVHFNLYVPDSYDGSEPCAVFFTLPGYEGLYFQGAGENLYSENFGFEAQQYDPDMIIVAPQLSDWGDTSAEQTIELAEYFLANYNIDLDRVYGEGYSGGGYCTRTGKCRYDDRVNDFLETAKEYDGFIFGAPVHFTSAAASMSAFMDRSFFVDHCADLKLFELKPGVMNEQRIQSAVLTADGG